MVQTSFNGGMQILTVITVVLLTTSNVIIGKARAEECIPKGTYENCTREPRFKNCTPSLSLPDAKLENSNYSGTVGSNVTMICFENNFYNIPYFDWIRWDKVPIEPDIDSGSFQVVPHQNNGKKYRMKHKSGYKGDLFASLFTILDLTEDDQGLYSCIICGDYGRSFVSVFLSVSEGSTSNSAASTVPMGSSTDPLDGGGKKISRTILVLVIVMALILVILIICVAMAKVWSKVHHKYHDMEQPPPSMANPAFDIPDNEHGTRVLRERFLSETSTISSIGSSAPLLKARNSSTRSPLCSNTSAISAITEFSYADELPDYQVDEKWEIDRSCLLMKEQIGAGAFGAVNRATAFGLPGMPQQCTVAVKMLKENAGDSELIDLLAEIETLKEIGNHKNIINLIGTSTLDGPVLLIVDFAPHGNLREFLRKHRPSESKCYQTHTTVLKTKDLLSFVFQVARGMVFLSSKKCIHRDLAARNVLVAKDYVMKISDFGLSRNVKETDYYRKTSHGRLPVKWLPPEALFDQQYTVQSDVWSFGVLLWEIFTMGATPYPGIEVEKLFTLLKNGYRMEAPSNCTPEIYELMLNCWQNNPKDRPTFDQIERELEQLLASCSDQEYLEVLAKPEDLKRAARESSLRKTPQRTGRDAHNESCV